MQNDHDYSSIAIVKGSSPTNAFRLAAGVSTGLLASKTGIPVWRIEEIEAGFKPDAVEARSLARALDLPVSLLLDMRPNCSTD